MALKGLKTRENRLELRRQLVHMTGGVLISIMAYLMKPLLGWLIVFPVLGGLAWFLSAPKLFPNLKDSNSILFHFEREEDVRTLPYRGAIYFGFGMLIPLALLPTEPACAAIIVLSVGDALSTIIGRLYGRVRIGGKSLEGFAAFVISSFIAALAYVDPKTAIVFAVIGGVVELIPHANDNISIPAALTLAYKTLL
ncbi:MAG: hypothetical protein ABIH11_01230 [Candidatus Altiarchaeota archaeon]